jgi:hypothetical protein
MGCVRSSPLTRMGLVCACMHACRRQGARAEQPAQVPPGLSGELGEGDQHAHSAHVHARASCTHPTHRMQRSHHAIYSLNARSGQPNELERRTCAGVCTVREWWVTLSTKQALKSTPSQHLAHPTSMPSPSTSLHLHPHALAVQWGERTRERESSYVQREREGRDSRTQFKPRGDQCPVRS